MEVRKRVEGDAGDCIQDCLQDWVEWTEREKIPQNGVDDCQGIRMYNVVGGGG